MHRPFFLQLEDHPTNQPVELESIIVNLGFDDSGLIPVITQDDSTGDILMFAWMNEESLRQTIELRRMTYWSRSRQQLWLKGETSGHYQDLVSMAFDCDGDAIVCRVNQQGAACHTGRNDCFYLEVDLDKKQVNVRGKK